MSYKNLTLEFLKLENAAWLECSGDVQVLQKLLTPALERSYHILEHKFSYVPLWKFMKIPYGDAAERDYISFS